MCAKNIFFVLSILLAHSMVQGKSKTNNGLANLNCPLDDDPNDPTHLPVQGDCTKFLKCSYGIAYTLSCPTGLYWSANLDRCESKDVAKCDPSVTTTRPIIGVGCSFDYKPHPTDCNKAIQCASGQETVLECLEGTYWNQDRKRCDFDDSHC